MSPMSDSPMVICYKSFAADRIISITKYINLTYTKINVFVILYCFASMSEYGSYPAREVDNH